MKRDALLLGAVLLAVSVAYSGHFHNAFHFDDGHAIQNNLAIRDLRNIPRFFADVYTFSTLPDHCVYRPLTTVLMSVEWAVQRGDVLGFHQVTFELFLALLTGVYLLLRKLLASAWLAAFGAAVYGLHPALADTLNYPCQAAEVLSGLLIVGGLLVYLYLPGRWRWLCLLGCLAVLAKASGAAFPPMLLAVARPWRKMWPAVALTLALLVLVAIMAPKGFATGSRDPWGYRLAQPAVAAHFARSFVLPTELTADSDWDVAPSWHSNVVVVGVCFLVTLGLAAWKLPELRMGIFWFLAAFLPSAVYPLAEVMNDHRMFVPFLGLALVAAVSLGKILESRPFWQRSIAEAVVAVLVLAGYATHARCATWATESSLWADAAQKSPHNGRALMNYGLTRLNAGDFRAALQWFNEAKRWTPYYNYLWINEGIAFAAMSNYDEAERDFKAAIQFNPIDPQGYFFYGRYLSQRGRTDEARVMLQTGLKQAPQHAASRELLAVLR